MKRYSLLIACGVISWSVSAQQLTVDQAVENALKNNPSIRAAEYNVQGQRQLRKTGFDLPKTDVTYMRGQYNSYSRSDNNLTILQSIPFAALGSQASLNRAHLAYATLQKSDAENVLAYHVRQTYNQLVYAYARQALLMRQDTIFEQFSRSANLRYKTGETNLLEQTTAEAQRNDSRNRLYQADADIVVLRTRLKALLNSEGLPDALDRNLNELTLAGPTSDLSIEANPALAVARQQVEVSTGARKVAVARFAPDLLVGYFNQTLIGAIEPETGRLANSSERFSGFQLGLSLPLWFGPHQGRARAAEFDRQAAQSRLDSERLNLEASLQQALREFEKNRERLDYYRNAALPNAELIMEQSQLAFRSGEAGYAEYLLALRSAISIQEGYLLTLHDYNQSIITLEFLSVKK